MHKDKAIRSKVTKLFQELRYNCLEQKEKMIDQEKEQTIDQEKENEGQENDLSSESLPDDEITKQKITDKNIKKLFKEQLTIFNKDQRTTSEQIATILLVLVIIIVQFNFEKYLHFIFNKADQNQ